MLGTNKAAACSHKDSTASLQTTAEMKLSHFCDDRGSRAIRYRQNIAPSALTRIANNGDHVTMNGSVLLTRLRRRFAIIPSLLASSITG